MRSAGERFVRALGRVWSLFLSLCLVLGGDAGDDGGDGGVVRWKVPVLGSHYICLRGRYLYDFPGVGDMKSSQWI